MLDKDPLVEEIDKALKERHDDYLAVSNFVLRECLRFKVDHPLIVRAVFSREPQLKELSSILKKIQDARVEDENYGFDNVHDIIAFTILVPFWSDTDRVIEWMKETFSVPENLNRNPLRDNPTGHRAYHYIVLQKASTIRGEPDRLGWFGIKCEIQIKSILSEAWDAKAHNLTYKSGTREVSAELKEQFAVLARILRGVDDQSEFLKNEIEEEEKEIRARQDACRELCVGTPETIKLGSELGITSALDTSVIAEKLTERAASQTVDLPLCQLAAYWSLERENRYLKTVAVKIVNMYEARKDGSQQQHCERIFRGGSIKWALGL